MAYLFAVLWPYLLVAVAIGIALGWLTTIGAEKSGPSS